MANTKITSNVIADNAVGISALNVSDGSDGQVLTTNGSGTLSFATVSGTTINNNADNRVITGSGTANTLEGEANLTFDGTNLGIGASTIDAKLHIEVSSGDANLKLEDGSATYMLLDQNSIGGSGVVRFKTGSNLDERMRITSAGSVGINETSPDFSGFGSNGGGLELDDVGSSFTAVKVSQGSTGNLYLAATTGAGYLWQHSNSPLLFGTNNAEAMRLLENGRLNLGGVAHSADINQAMLNTFISSSTIPTCRFAQGNTSSSVPVIRVRHENSTAGFYLDFRTDENAVTGGIKDVSGTMQYQSASDSRLKENVEPMAEGLTEVLAMNPVKFNWKDIVTENKTVNMEGAESRGFLAQELNEEYPWAVSEGGEDEKDDPWSVDYGKLTPILVKAIQEQQTIIDDLKSRIETLEG